ncbi:DUF6346 domain-containing protein [Plantactinospora sp. BB1]|uniref:DUF6346 domain-containing protein n=1 Tax=Plantactinospora sp. BB1 TaxID=2071627 RepID=UPI0035190DD6
MVVVLGLVLLACFAQLTFATLISIYPGTGSIRPYGPSERTVQVVVESCHRVGPISKYGLGNWWVCRVREPSGGHETEGVVSGSIVRPDDVGTVIELRQACSGTSSSDCSYGKPTGFWWQVYYGSIYVVFRLLMIASILCACIFLVRAIFGVPRYLALLRRMGISV